MAATQKRGRPTVFYVFYDKHDFVRCFGTAKQLVDDGVYKTIANVRSAASKTKKGELYGNVVILQGKVNR